MPSKLLVCVTNYEFNSNAIKLKHFFERSFETIIIDSSTPGGFPEADITIDNTYYPGLWNESVSQAIKRDAEWLLFIASNIQLIEAEMSELCIHEAISDPNLMMWTPSLAENSSSSLKSTLNRPTAGMRHCGMAEGFCFMARTRLLQQQHPIPSENIFGYGVDAVSSLRAHELGTVAVDDRITIFYPPSKAAHQINTAEASSTGTTYLNRFSFSEEIKTRVHLLEQAAKDEKNTPALKSQTSLDLGCGAKPNDLLFKTGNASGIDVRNPENRPEIKLSDLFIHPIPHQSSSFDYITAFDFIEHVPRLVYLNEQCRFCFVELMNEIYRVLKPGGIFASLTPTFPNQEAFQDPTHVNIITERTFPKYFCKPYDWAAMYGFTGSFSLIHQSSKADGKLLTLMRAIKTETSGLHFSF
tara:strand:- start:615 stop:1853 length:1239 start_codon:yes stop_codon:yes gene_type:complete